MKKRIRFDYGEGVISLPRDKVAAVCAEANETALRVLLLASSLERLHDDYDACCAELRARLDITQSTLDRALGFWRDSGVVKISDITESGSPVEGANASAVNTAAPGSQAAASASGDTAPTETTARRTKPLLMPSTLPSYSETQCADIIANSPDLGDVIDMCQQLTGRIFTSADVSVIVTLYDYLGLGGDYIATLIAYLKQNGKKSLRYIERTALSLFDEGVDTLDALNAYIKHKEDSAENFSKIRRLIGASSRELTTREKKAFACWLDEWGFEFDVINRAYEITVDKINEPSVAYMNRVLENWHKSGLNTLEAVEVSLEAYKKSKAEAAQGTSNVNGTESGFKTDEFFEAALRRSFKAAAQPDKDGK